MQRIATIAVFLIVALILGRSVFQYLNRPERRAARVVDAWNRSYRREALELCEKISVSEPRLNALLPAMYLDVADEIHSTEPTKSAEFRDKAILLVTDQTMAQPTNPIRLFAAASVFDRTGDGAKALEFYRRAARLFEHDVKAIAAESAVAAGGVVDQAHQEAALIELRRQLQMARERIAALEQEQREFAVDFQLSQRNQP